MSNSEQDIYIRKFEKRDITRRAELAVDAWSIVSSLVSPSEISLLMKAYVEITKLGSTWLEVATIKNIGIVGFLFGKIIRDQKPLNRVRAFLPSIKILLKIILGKYGKLAEPFVFLKHVFATEQEVQHHTPKLDGKITLFVVDSAYRGKGIGQALLNRFLIKAKHLDSHLISVYTDPLSNWRFYQKFGFVRHRAFLDDLNTYIKKRDTEGYIYTLVL